MFALTVVVRPTRPSSVSTGISGARPSSSPRLIVTVRHQVEESRDTTSAGLGGSAANASHAVNDFRKIAGIEAYTPVDNVAELTAWTNDVGFDCVFVNWLDTSRLAARDCVMVLSVGGGSESTSHNLVLAMRRARAVGASIVSIVSRDGGAARQHSDACVLIPVVSEGNITPHAEGWQAVIWHLVVNAIR
jgi:D-sedoheptulose 7-phosphate isomerase